MKQNKQLSIDDVKSVSLEMLKNFDAICKKYSIRYFLGYGTLLGSVRHKGYIPWDDDIDLMMLREDFEKLTELFNQNPKIFNECSLNLLCLNVDSKSVYAFGKLCDTRTYSECQNEAYVEGLGVSIDIFPYDFIRDNSQKSLKKLMFLYRLNGIRVRSMKLSYTPSPGKNSGNIIDKLLYTVGHLFGTSFWTRTIQRLSMSQKKDTGYVACKVMGKKIFPTYIFQESIDMQFEDAFFPAPTSYDEYLKIQYGDYMTIPPVEQQVRMHNFTAYWKA